VERYGSYIFLSEKELNWADRFFDKWGDWAVFVSRLLPVVRTFIALPAGIAKMRQVRFHVFTFVGSWPWCFMLAWIGMRLGEHWDKDPRLKEWFHRFDAVILGVILIGVVWFVWTHWQHRIRRAS
jgi:membrane protein DedA with SNARE-associated domain